MIFERMENTPGARFLLVAACLVVVVAGLKAAAPILVPFCLALFLAVVSMPIMNGLRKHRVPNGIAILLTVLVDVLVFGLLILLGISSVSEFSQKRQAYESGVSQLLQTWSGRFESILSSVVGERFPVQDYFGQLTSGLFDPAAIFDFVGNSLQVAASLLSMAFLVTLVMVFVLAEATVFPEKFHAIFGRQRRAEGRMTRTVHEVQIYLGIKTLVSLATGLCAGVLCWILDLDFPVLLGLVAFGLNFVPTIGSIIAAAPAMVIALLLFDWPRMVIVAVGYLVINTVFGNLLEPNLLGRRLGLSTLVVVLSLLFWGWIWGPIGALLSVPLTMVLKIVVENAPDLRWLAVLLDKSPPPDVSDGAVAATEPGGSPASPAPRVEATAPPAGSGAAD